MFSGYAEDPNNLNLLEMLSMLGMIITLSIDNCDYAERDINIVSAAQAENVG